MRITKTRIRLITAVSLGIAALCLGILFWPAFTGDSGIRDIGDSESESGGFAPYRTDEIVPGVTEDIIDSVRTGRIDLQAELRNLRSHCPARLNTIECDRWVMDLLYQLPAPDNQKLAMLFKTYLQYEQDRRSLGESTLTMEEKYRLIQKKRLDLFGEEDSKLVFGLEEANFYYQRLIQEFSGDTHSQTPPDERLRIFESKRRQIFGPYYETLKERESPDSRYGLELLVRQTEIQKMHEPDRKSYLRSLRLHYYGEERALEMEREISPEQAALADRNTKLNEFLKAEEEFLKKNPGIQGEEKARRIEEIRKQIYGE